MLLLGMGIFNSRRPSGSSSRRSSMAPTGSIYSPPSNQPQPSPGYAPFVTQPQSSLYAPPIQSQASARPRHMRRQSSTHRYESDSELPSNQRVYAPPMAPAPTSMTPHPGEKSSPRGRDRRSSERHVSDSSQRPLGERRGSDGSSRSGMLSSNAGTRPLRGILKSTSKHGPQPSPSPPQPLTTNSHINPSDVKYVPVEGASPLESSESKRGRSRPRHMSAPAGTYEEDMPRQILPPVRNGSTSSGTSNDSPPPPRIHRPSRDSPTSALKAEQISLNWLLTNKFQRQQSNPPIFFDVAWPPSRPNVVMGWVWSPSHGRQIMQDVPDVYLHEPASTHTLMSTMVVYCPRGVLGAAPVKIANAQGVTCMNVLTAVYNAYNRVISPADLTRIGQEELDRMHRHFRRRCEDSHVDSWLEETYGYRYVDLLRGSRRRIYKGLKQRDGPGIAFDLCFEDSE